jgi:hypothetical protein
MPGFAVNGVNGNFGGQAGAGAGVAATQEYVYTYSWEIFQLFENFDNLLINAKDITTPTFSVGIETQQGASLEYKFAKSVSYDDVKVTFYDVVGFIGIFKEWRESVWTNQDGLKVASDYKKRSSLGVYPPDWDRNKGEIWSLTGSWPSVIRHGELTYTSSDVKVVEITVTYDYAETADQA